jgi:hypothetical protein
LLHDGTYNAAGIVIAAGAYAAGTGAKRVARLTGIGNGLRANTAVDLLQVADGFFADAQFADLILFHVDKN